MKCYHKKTAALFSFIFIFCGAINQLCAQTMTAEESADARTKLIKYSKQFIGCRYASGGIGPDTFDCSGLVFTCARESIGVQLPRMTTAMYSFVTIIPDSEREAGDLVFFKTTSSGDISHVGIYMGNDQFIHAASDGPNTGVIVSSLKENYWKSKYDSTGQFLPPTHNHTLADPADVAESNSSDSNNTAAESPKEFSSSGKSASAKKSSSGSGNSSSAGAGKFSDASSWIADASFSFDWNFFTSKYIKLNFRGISGLAHIRYADSKLQPGAGVMFRYDTGTGTVQIPLVLSISPSNFFRIYAGPVISIGTAYLPGDDDTEIKASFFPGILGVIWQTPSFNAGKAQISFVQDIHYTVFNDTDNSALSLKNSLASGLVFSSGLRVTLPLGSLIK